MRHPLRPFAGLVLGIAVVVVACSDDPSTQPVPDEVATTSSGTRLATTTTGATEPAPTTAGEALAPADGCWVDLFEEDDFDEGDDHLRLTRPGRYADLRNLPEATGDWTDEAESIRVGPGATVTIWPDTDFRGTPLELGPGSALADVDDEPESLELSC